MVGGGGVGGEDRSKRAGEPESQCRHVSLEWREDVSTADSTPDSTVTKRLDISRGRGGVARLV